MSSTGVPADAGPVQSAQRGHRGLVGAFGAGAGRLGDRSRVLEPGVAEDDPELASDEAVAGIRAPLAWRAGRQPRIVPVQADEPVDADPVVELADEVVDAPRVTYVDVHRPQV